MEKSTVVKGFSLINSLFIRSIRHIHLYFKDMDGLVYTGERNYIQMGMLDRVDIERIY